MKMVMVIGRPNETLDGIIERLSERFVVRTCTENFSAFEDMIFISPDAFVVSLMGSEIRADLLERLRTVYHGSPVITVGSEIERIMFMSFYRDSQFRHLSTPVSGQQVLDAINEALGHNEGGSGPSDQSIGEIIPGLEMWNGGQTDSGDDSRGEKQDGTANELNLPLGINGDRIDTKGSTEDETVDKTDGEAQDGEPSEAALDILGIMAMMREEREQKAREQKAHEQNDTAPNAKTQDASGQSQKLGKVQSKPIRTDKAKVLVVDDDPMILRGVKAMLDDRYQVTLATSGVRAISAIAKNRPDVILLDYEMPVCDGKQTLEMIRSDETIRDIPVVFLTGVSDKSHIYAVLALRPFGYIVKPAEKERLIETIERAVSGMA